MSWPDQVHMKYIIPPSLVTLSQFGGSVDDYTLTSIGEEKGRTAYQRQQALLREFRQLTQRLEQRPFDIRTLLTLANVSYQCREYECTIRVITKLIKLNESKSHMLLVLAKCYVKRWIRDKTINDLHLALKTYKSATSIPDIAQHPSPIPWFEMASVLLRLGRYQDTMNMLGIVLTLYKTDEYEDWLIICQYNIAQVLLLSGELQQAYDLYQELLLYQCDIVLRLEQDHVIMLPLRMQYSVLLLEIAHISSLLGHSKLAREVMRENWLSIHHSLKQGKNNVDDLMQDADAMAGIASIFQSNHNYFMTAEFLGMSAQLLSQDKEWDDLSYEQRARVIELVLRRGELLSEVHSYQGAEHCAHFAVSRCNGDFVIMARAAKCCRADQASNAELVNSADEIIRAVMRVQWALRSVFWRIKKKLRLNRIAKATKLVAFARMCIVRNKLIADRLGHLSPMRMLSVATKLRKCGFSTGKKVIDDYFVIWNAASRMIQRLVGNWKRRRAWRVFWVGIQIFQRVAKGQLVRRVLREKIVGAQRLLNLRSDHANDRLDGRSTAQSDTTDGDGNNSDVMQSSRNPSPQIASPIVSQRATSPGRSKSPSTQKKSVKLDAQTHEETADNISDNKSNSKPIRRTTFAILSTSCFPAIMNRSQTSRSLKQFVTAAHVLTMDTRQGDDDISIEDDSNTFLTNSSSRLEVQVPSVRSAATASISSSGPSHDQPGVTTPVKTPGSRQGNGGKSSTSTQLPVIRAKSFTQRAIPPKIMDAVNDPNSPSGATKKLSPARTAAKEALSKLKSSSSIYSAKSSMLVPGDAAPFAFRRELALDPLHANHDPNTLHLSSHGKDIVNPLHPSNMNRKTGGRSNSYYSLPANRIDEQFLLESGPKGQYGISWFSCKQIGNTATEGVSSKHSLILHSSSQQSFSSTKSLEELETLVQSCHQSRARQVTAKGGHNAEAATIGDIMTQISIYGVRSAYDRGAMQWIPFSIIPDAEIHRLLCCTVLTITSPSFCVTDCKRLARIAKTQRRNTNVWSRLKSLLIYGTRMGESGLLSLMSLNIKGLTSLSIGYTDALTHSVTTNMALQFMHQTCNLVKLTIEGERRCGDRGIVILLKHLQYNTSLQSLVLRDCGLSTRTAQACARYLGVTQSLQHLNVNDNQFSPEDVLCVVRALASRGARGTVDSVSIKDQFPPLTDVVIRSIHQYATALGVRVEADAEIIDAVYETKLELSRPQWMDDDVRWNDSIAIAVESMRQDGKFLGEGLRTRYAKKLCL